MSYEYDPNNNPSYHQDERQRQHDDDGLWSDDDDDNNEAQQGFYASSSSQQQQEDCDLDYGDNMSIIEDEDANVDTSFMPPDGEKDGSEDEERVDNSNNDDECSTTSNVLQKIENLMASIVESLDNDDLPWIGTKSFWHTTHCRSITSMLMVASFCYDLLQSHRTTTTREVYYFFVTHFRNQAECDKAIKDLCWTLNVPRSTLGLVASPKGWYCGCLELYNDAGELIVNGRELDAHGMAITATTSTKYATIQSDAYCILVVEKEGVYTRLSEDKFFLHHYPSILVTGKGFPDVATRQWVQQLQRELKLPAFGLCDCNPYGVSVLNTYYYEDNMGLSNKRKQTNNRDYTSSTFELQWIGLRPSQLTELDLPSSVFQQLTKTDQKRLKSLKNPNHPFHQSGAWNPQLRMEELEQMTRKVELEALNWKGMDFLCEWVATILRNQDNADEAGVEEAEYII